MYEDMFFTKLAGWLDLIDGKKPSSFRDAKPNQA
jgi:hypothetical protein